MSRTPATRDLSRIAPLAVLPVFFKLAGRRVLLAGAGEGMAWKAELLASTGALVFVVAAEEDVALAALAARDDLDLIVSVRAWNEPDFDAMALAVGDFEDEDEAEAFRAAAQAAGVPVNLVDRPALCDFQFGSIVNRSPLVVGISTDGAAPVFGQAIRSRIEMLLPAGFQAWAEAARQWRPLVQARELSLQARRRIWELFVGEALRRPADAPVDADREALLAAVEHEVEATPHGSVALVGAGPGDPELLTLKAVRALQSADVILYDDLVSDDVLDFARREAQRIAVGKRGHRPSCKQSDVNGLLVSLAREGKRVIRLKGGDPLIFGRAGEEIDACRQAGIAVEVVPGISAAMGAAASLDVSLTHRDHARRLQFITAHARDGRLPADLDWQALADPAATTAVYMGKLVVAEVSARLIATGLDATTPAIIVEYATQGRQRNFFTSIAAMPALFEREHLEGPCVMLIGRAMGEAPGFGEESAGRA